MQTHGRWGKMGHGGIIHPNKVIAKANLMISPPYFEVAFNMPPNYRVNTKGNCCTDSMATAVLWANMARSTSVFGSSWPHFRGYSATPHLDRRGAGTVTLTSNTTWLCNPSRGLAHTHTRLLGVISLNSTYPRKWIKPGHPLLSENLLKKQQKA